MFLHTYKTYESTEAVLLKLEMTTGPAEFLSVPQCDDLSRVAAPPLIEFWAICAGGGREEKTPSEYRAWLKGGPQVA